MADIGFDQDLLKQFSCMGTTDKEVLISDLHDLLGSQLSREGCAFFLDMTNWNLQAAVGAYYDFYGFNQVSLPEMCLVEDVAIRNGEILPPGTPFTKIWRIRNSGSMQWPSGVFLSQKSGHTFNGPPMIEVPPLDPGDEVNVSVNLESPFPTGEYQSQWRLCNSDGAVCGEALWVIIKVEEAGVIGLTQQFSSITTRECEMEEYDTTFTSPILPTSNLTPVPMPTVGVVSSTSTESGMSDSGTGLHECGVFMESGLNQSSSILDSSQDNITSSEVRKLSDISYDAIISHDSAHELDTSIEDQQSL